MKFRTSLHATYAEYLGSLPSIKSFDYCKVRQRWQDGFTGKWHWSYCHFKIIYTDGNTEHVQVLPVNLQMPLTKYLYMENNLDNWRWINAAELGQCTRNAFLPVALT